MSEHQPVTERNVTSQDAPHASSPDRTMRNVRERVTVAEAAQRLGITPGAVRMRISRGKLAVEQVGDDRFVLWPPTRPTGDAHVTRNRTHDAQPDADTIAHDASRALRDAERLVTSLEERNRDLQGERDAWQAQAERLAGLLEAEQVNRALASGMTQGEASTAPDPSVTHVEPRDGEQPPSADAETSQRSSSRPWWLRWLPR